MSARELHKNDTLIENKFTEKWREREKKLCGREEAGFKRT